MSLDLLPNLRDALIGDLDSVADVAQWNGEPAVFTRRPVPADAPYPHWLLNPPAALTDIDGLTSDRPYWVGDVICYGEQPDHLRAVDRMAHSARLLFHRNKFSVRPDGYSVISIVAAGPIPAPVDDETTVGRLVTLTIQLRRTS